MVLARGVDEKVGDMLRKDEDEDEAHPESKLDSTEDGGSGEDTDDPCDSPEELRR